jgi:signal peptidase I
MENTVLVGDRILVRRFPRPKLVRDDLVVFLYPIHRQETYIERLIGMPGDRIRISNKILYRNGVAQNEAYAAHKTTYVDLYRDNFPSEPNTPLPEAAMEMLRKHNVNGEIVVPEGKYFVMGDNRDNSADSRYWGFLDDRDVIGKPVLIYDSEDQTTEDLSSGKVPVRRSIRWQRFFKPL